MGISLLTGISFTIGVLIVLLARDIYEEQEESDEMWESNPASIVIEQHSIKSNEPRFTVVGDVRNDSDQDWKRVWIDVRVFAGSALVNTCDESVGYIAAQSNKRFEVRCYDIAGSDLPDNIHYEISIRSGLR
jgi:hypothetical protein